MSLIIIIHELFESETIFERVFFPSCLPSSLCFLIYFVQRHEECEKVKLALEEVLNHPPSEKVVINNELAGIINRHTNN